MNLTVEERINATPQQVWEVVTDIDHAAENITGITELEILDRPTTGLIGLKWKEKRIMFGKEASETMWITGVEHEKWYEVAASSHGADYLTRIMLEPVGGDTLLSMSFNARPQTIGGKLMYLALGFLFRGATKKALQQDLTDIRLVAERSASG